MPVPDFQSFMLPLLRRCADCEEHPPAYFRAKLSGDLKVSEEETKEKLPSGRQTKYENRIYWAAIYLHRAECLERVRRGVFKITSRGQKLLSDRPDQITVQLLNQFPEFKIFHTGKIGRSLVSSPINNGNNASAEIDDTQTPEEALENS